MKEYGYFLDNGKDFLITEPNIPRNWYNYLWNDNYVTFISQTGAGESLLQDDLGRRQKLVPPDLIVIAHLCDFPRTSFCP